MPGSIDRDTPKTLMPILRSERLLLRAVETSDAAAILPISYYDGRRARDEAEALAMLRRIHDDCRRGESLHWGICLSESNAVVGTCGYYRGFHGGVGEIGYVLREEQQGRGIMTEAVELIVRHGFEALGLHEVVAYTDRDNLRSTALLERLGFVRVDAAEEEGRLRYSRTRY